VTGIKRIFFVCTILLGLLSKGVAQDTSTTRHYTPRQLKQLGKSGMEQGDFYAASMYYEKYMKARPNDYQTAFKLAESFRLSRDYVQALTWYEKSYTLSKNTYFLPVYYYALMLKINGNCDKAKENFLLFRKKADTDELSQQLKKQSKNDIAGCDSLQGKEPKNKLIVTHLDTSINKIHVEASPIFLDDSNIVYSALRSNRKEYIIPNDSLATPVRKLYMAKKTDGKWTYNGEYKGPDVIPGMNVGGGAFSQTGKRFYFTQCKHNWKNRMICALYVAEYTDGNWGTPELLNKQINLPDFSSFMPTVAVSAKGLETVYFVSNREGGKGGNDIWFFTYSEKGKKYTAPRNAGGKINTPNDEMTPYYDQETGSLYFSSEGWPGMGGMDVFRSVGELKNFSVPENLGKGINTSYDDLNFTISKNRESGMLVSNRKGGVSNKNLTCCDDLYEYKRLEFVKMRITGTVFGGKDSATGMPMLKTNLKVYVTDPASPEIAAYTKTITTDDAGKFDFPIEPGMNYKVVAEKDNYLNDAFTVSTVNVTTSKTVTHNFHIAEIPKEGFLLKNVYYASDKSDLSPASQKGIDTTLFRLLNENPDLKIEIGSHTDDVGSDKYNTTLSQKRADGVVKYLISKGISADRLTAHGYGKSMPKVPNRNPDGTANPANQEKNRRTEFKVIGKVDNIDIRNED
jgi:outer membrane protein OmpA-like peptidoglycan-associated protein